MWRFYEEADEEAYTFVTYGIWYNPPVYSGFVDIYRVGLNAWKVKPLWYPAFRYPLPFELACMYAEQWSSLVAKEQVLTWLTVA